MSPLCFVGEIVKSQNLQGVVLDYLVENTDGWFEPLLVYIPQFNEPVVIESYHIEKTEFKDASPECQLISKELLFRADSKKYLH